VITTCSQGSKTQTVRQQLQVNTTNKQWQQKSQGMAAAFSDVKLQATSQETSGRHRRNNGQFRLLERDTAPSV